MRKVRYPKIQLPKIKVICTTKKKPKNQAWKNAQLFSVYFSTPKTPICGLHLVWAVVGRKWVKIIKPISDAKFKLSVKDWNDLNPEPKNV